MRLGGALLVEQAAPSDGVVLDPLSLGENGRGTAEVGVGRGDVVEALVASAMVVVLDEVADGGLECARQRVRLIAPHYVKPFIKRQKNDAADAEAIVEAAQRPTARRWRSRSW